MIAKTMRAWVWVAAGLMLVGCVSSRSGNVYTREEARRVQSVEYGQIANVRPVVIEGDRSGVGAIAGGVLGGAIGSIVGGDSHTRLIVGTIGAIGGAIAGQAVGEGVTRQQAVELTVRMDSGETLVIVQGGDQPFNPGDRVQVVRSGAGNARVSPVLQPSAPTPVPQPASMPAPQPLPGKTIPAPSS